MNNILFKIFVTVFLMTSVLTGCKSKKGVVKKRSKKSDSSIVIEKVKDLVNWLDEKGHKDLL